MKKFLSLLALMLLCSIGAWAQAIEESKVKTYRDLTDASGTGISAENYYLMALPGRSNTALAYYTTSYNKIVCANNQYAANKAYPASYVYQLESANDDANALIKNLGKSSDNYIHVASGDYANGQGKVTVDGTSENAERWQIYKGVETAYRFHFNTTGATEIQRTLSNNGGLGYNLGFWNGGGSDRWTDTGGQFSFIKVEPITISVEDLEGNNYPFSVNGTDCSAGANTIYVENFTNFTLTCSGTPAKYKVNGVEQTEVPTWASGMTVVAVLDRTIYDANKVVALNATKITDVASINQNKAYLLKNTGRNFYMGLNSSNKGVGKQYHKHTNSTSNLMWYILPQSDGTYKLQSVFNQQYVPALSQDAQFTTATGAENGDNFTIIANGGKFAFVSTAKNGDNNIYLDGNPSNPVGWSATGNPASNNAYEIYEVETANYNMPAIPVTSGNYYMLKVKNNWVGFNGETGAAVNGGTMTSPVITPADDMQGYYWKFEGNNEDGWTLTNKGTGKTYHTNNDVTDLPEGTGKWIIEYNPVSNAGWRLIAKDTEKTYANLRETILGTWVNDLAADNDGCVIVFQESIPIEFNDENSYYMYTDVRGTRRYIDLTQNSRTNTALVVSQKLTFEANSENNAYYIKDAVGNYVKQLTQSSTPETTTNQTEAGEFTLRPFANGLAIGKKGDNNATNTGWHLNDVGNLVGWACNADANKWQLADITIPETGHFYTFKGVANENHMTSLLDGSNKVVVNSTATGKDIIWYVGEDNKLIAYGNGMSPWIGGSGTSGLKMTSESGITAVSFEHFAANQMCIKLNDRYAYNANATLDSGTGNGGNSYPGYKWIVEEVTELPVTIAASGLTTFYAPVNMKVNGDVNVYVGAIDAGESVITYTKLADQKIHAGTGVLIKGEQSGSITISPIDEEVEAQTSCLVGHEYTEACTQTSESHGDKYIYTLQSGVFKYYTGTKLTGFKAHLELNKDHRDANGNSNLRVVFTDETLTGIESIAAEDNQSIFDLQGRRVNNAQKGIYIMNGKKVLR